MILSPSRSLWLPQREVIPSRFGPWWRRAREFRASLGAAMGNLGNKSGHLTYKPGSGHLSTCALICAYCSTGTTPSTFTVSMSGSDVFWGPPCDNCGGDPSVLTYSRSGNIDGTYTLLPQATSPFPSTCAWTAAMSQVVTYTRQCPSSPEYVYIFTFSSISVFVGSTSGSLSIAYSYTNPIPLSGSPGPFNSSFTFFTSRSGSSCLSGYSSFAYGGESSTCASPTVAVTPNA